MALYGAPTPKRHVLWGNSPGIQKLDLGQMKGWAKKVQAQDASGEERVKTVKKYINKDGRQCWKGDVGLKPSESETYFSMHH